jgi:nicotinamide-nucleotide amidase
MNAEVISIGDELTSGTRLDTNSRWISQRLVELGLAVHYHTTVDDDLRSIIRVFQAAIERADVVVVSGGLGPTADDLTRAALAEATATELIHSPEAMAVIRERFARRGRPMPSGNEVQALLPAGSQLVPNPHGTAPGIAMEIARSDRGPAYLFALPGVPSELFEMWQATVAAAIAAACPAGDVIRQHEIHCFGAGESRIEAMLPDLIRRGRIPTVGITASQSTITLRVTATGTTAEQCAATMQPTIKTIRECLGNLVFGEGDETLQSAVGRLLERSNRTLATIELGTGGTLAHWLSETVVVAAGGYLGGLTIGSLVVAARLLPLAHRKVASAAGPPASAKALPSRELVESLAAACRTATGADFALATGPLAEDPSADRPAEPFYFALADAAGITVKADPGGGPPAMAQTRSAKVALNAVRLALLDGE